MRVKSWALVPLLGLFNILIGYIITKLLDNYVYDDVTSFSEITVSPVHWVRFIPAIIIGLSASVLLFYICKNLEANIFTKILTYIGSSFVFICVFLSGSWYKDPIYTIFLPEDDYYHAEKTNFITSNGAMVVWSDECVQSGRIVYCYVNFKNLSKSDQEVSINYDYTYLMTGEKSIIRASSEGKLGNKSHTISRKVVAPSKLTILYGIKFELPEPTKYETIPSLRLSVRVSGYKDLFSMANRPLFNVSGH